MARKLGIFGLSALALAAIAWSSVASATVPPKLTQQGRLLDSTGVPIAGTVSFQFSLYDVSTGGSNLWTETQSITLDSGYFSAVLGDAYPLDLTKFDGKVLYLGIKVATDAEMTPRQPLLSVPYALVANNAIGNITPTSITVNGVQIVKPDGTWGGAQASLVGPQGLKGDQGIKGDKGDKGDPGVAGTAASFSSLQTVTGAVSATSSAGSYLSNYATSTATCPALKYATGGGCTVYYQTSGYAALKESEPTGGAPSTSWTCVCAGMNGTDTCSVTPFVICGP